MSLVLICLQTPPIVGTSNIPFRLIGAVVPTYIAPGSLVCHRYYREQCAAGSITKVAIYAWEQLFGSF